jgi:hypothetical protein
LSLIKNVKSLFCFILFLVVLTNANANEIEKEYPSIEISFSHFHGDIDELRYSDQNYWLENDKLNTENWEGYNSGPIRTQAYKGVLKYPFRRNFWFKFQFDRGAGDYKINNHVYGGGFAYSISDDPKLGRFSTNKISTDFGIGLAESDDLKTYITRLEMEYSFNTYALLKGGYYRGILFNSLYQHNTLGLALNMPLVAGFSGLKNFDGSQQSVVLEINHQWYNTEIEKGRKMIYQMSFPLNTYATWFYAFEHSVSTPQRADYIAFNVGVRAYVH